MSIIVDALKKAQRPPSPSKITTPSSKSAEIPLPSPSLRKPVTKKHAGIWIFVAFLLLGGLSFHFLKPPPPPIIDSAQLKDEPIALKKEPAALKKEIREPSHMVSYVTEEPNGEAEPRIYSASAEASAPTPASVSTPVPTAAASAPDAKPSAPPLTLEAVSKAMDLNGIMYTPTRPRAIINGGVWGEGDRIGKFTILKIEENFVRVTSEGREFILRLKS